MVDRITPHTTDDDRAAVRERAGVDDPVPVVTEPYVEWVLSGEFPQGRPHWEDVGARFVDDVVPWEHRKLWLLNGSHSLMAYAGTMRGHETVEQAISDPVVRGWVEQWWDDAARHLPLPAEEIAAYRAALLERYANPRIRHLLRQIAADGSQKVPIRILPTVRADLAEGRVPTGAARVLAAWVCHLRGRGGRSPTWRPTSSPRSPRATWTTPWAACWPGSAPTTRGCTPPSRRWPASWRRTRGQLTATDCRRDAGTV